MNKFFNIFMLLILSVSLVSATTITPQKGLNLRDLFNLTNVNHIDATEICFGVDCRTAWPVNVTTAYIESLGFNTTADLDTHFMYIDGTNSNITKLYFNINPPAFNTSTGTLYWDVADKTLALRGEDWTLQIGQEIYVLVYNDKAYNITNGFAVTQDGAIADQPTVTYTDSSGIATGIVLGVSTQTIISGQSGMITILGIVHGLNTSAWSPGTILYSDSTGHLTDIQPSPFPAYPMTIGEVVMQDEFDGSMFVRPRTAEIDPIWGAEKVDYYNITETDILLANKLNISDALLGNGTNGTIAMWSDNRTLTDSPIRQTITDETDLLIYNGTFYIDATNQVAGINVVQGSESHEATFSVNTKWNSGTGTLTTGAYNSIYNYTDVTSDTLLPESLTWSTQIEYNSTEYFVFNYVNRTLIGIKGNYTGANALTITNWTFKPAPYSDVNGDSTDERGYSISSGGHWKWAIYTPADSNDTELCFQSTEFSNIVCMNNGGSVVVNGVLTAESINSPRYNGFVDLPTITPGNGTITVGSTFVNCYAGNDYANTLTEEPIAEATTGVGSMPALVSSINVINYIVADCDTGTPEYTVLTDQSLLDGKRYLLLALVLRFQDAVLGDTLHIQVNPNYGNGLPERSYSRIQDTQPFAVSSYSSLGITLDGLNVSINQFSVWVGDTKYIIPATNSSTLGALVYPIGNSSWNTSLTVPPKYNNSVYSNGTALIPFNTSYYGIIDVWRAIEDMNSLYMFSMPNEYPNLMQAEAETALAPTPTATNQNAVFIGRIIFQENNVSNAEIKIFTNTAFTSATPNQVHNALSGLQGGSGGSYFHLGQSDYTDIINHIFLNATDQRYNNTAQINAVNTTANIQSLGFNTTVQLDTRYYSITNPAGYLNASGVVSAVGNFSAENSTLARIGNCPGGQVVQNTTTGGVQCIPAGGTVTSINFTSPGLTGGLINESGTVTLNTTYLTTLFVPYIGATNNTDLDGKNLTTNGTINSRGTYGEMSNHTSGGSLTTVTQNVWENVTGMTLGESTSGFTVTNTSKLTVPESGMYDLTTFLNGAVNNNDVVGSRILINGVPANDTEVSMRFNSGLNNIMMNRQFYRFSAGDVIIWQLRDTTRNVAIISFSSRGVFMTKIGN